MKNVLFGAAASIAVAFAAAPAVAQERSDIVQVWGQLEESLAQDLADYGSRVEIVTGEQIRNGGYNDAAQVLQMQVPGLYIAPKNGPFDYVDASLLGGRRVDIIWLIDGVRVSNRLYTTTTPLDTIPASMIDKIEVLKGGQSLFYGTSAVSGAINIVTKGFTETQQGSFSVGASSNEGRHISGYTSGGFGDHRFVVFAGHDEAEGFQPFRDQDYQPSATDRNRGYDVTNMGVKYGYAFSDAVKFSANYQHTDATLDFAGAYDTFASNNDRDEDLLSAKLDWDLGDFDFFAKAYYHWWDTRFTDIRNAEAPNFPFRVVSNREFWGFEDYGVNLLGQYALSSSVTLLGGVDYQNYTGEDQVFLIAQQTEDVVAPFAQVRWNVGVLDGLKLAAGVRYNKPSGDGESTVWNVSGDLQISDYFYARGQVGTAFRLPDAYELFVVDPCCEQGNPNLKGEESTNYELGFGGRSDRVQWEITAFHRKLDDAIQIVTVEDARPNPLTQPGHLVPADCPFVTVLGCYDTFNNDGTRVETDGVEITASMQITDELSGTIDWTHTETQNDGSSLQRVEVPLDTAKLLVDYVPANLPVAGGIAATWVGELYDNAPSGLGRQEHGDYVVVDLNARWYLDADRKHRLSLRVENLFDEEYFSSIGRGFIDGTGNFATGANGTPYLAPNLGMNRAYHVSYSFDF